MKLPRLADLFEVHNARSRAFEDHESGQVAFITNVFENNGVIGFVKPLHGETVFKERGICLSAFCEATVQEPPFLPRGNGGSGLIVLKPISSMSYEQMVYYSAYVNESARWRFSFGRMVTKKRAKQIPMPLCESLPETIEISRIMPQKSQVASAPEIRGYKRFRISDLFELHSGDYHKASSLPKGRTPLVSCGESDNGIMCYCNVPQPHQYRNALTIAYNGSWPLLTKYHPYVFAAKDDVAVCIPRRKFRLSTLLYAQFMLNREVWRHSYGRKCFREKLKRFNIEVPIDDNGDLNEQAIENIVACASYWKFYEELVSKLEATEKTGTMEPFLNEENPPQDIAPILTK